MADPVASAASASFRTALASLKGVVARAGATAARDGGTGEKPADEPAVVSHDRQTLKAMLPGSLISLAAGGFAHVPAKDDAAKATGAFGMLVAAEPGVATTARNDAWCTTNVSAIYPGILTDTCGVGSNAGALTKAGMAVSVSVVQDPAGGTAVTHLKLVVPGVGEQIDTIDNVLGQLVGVPRRSWVGGPVQAPLRYGEGGIPSQADVQAAEVPPRHLVGGGPSAPLRIAKAMMVSLIDDGATDVAARRAAEWVCAAVDSASLRDGVALVLSCSAAVVNGAAPAAGTPAEAAAMITVRGALLLGLAALLDATLDERATATEAKLTSLAAGGFALGWAAGGTALRTTSDAAVAAPAIGPVVAPVAAPGANTSPKSLLIAQQAAELAALRAGAAVPTPAAISAAPVAAPATLDGMAVLQPPPSSTAPAPVGIQLWAEMGGEVILLRLAEVAGNTAPMIIMSGAGSAGTAADAARDFVSLLGAARAIHPLGGGSRHVPPPWRASGRRRRGSRSPPLCHRGGGGQPARGR